MNQISNLKQITKTANTEPSKRMLYKVCNTGFNSTHYQTASNTDYLHTPTNVTSLSRSQQHWLNTGEKLGKVLGALSDTNKVNG